jgi:hypothetical protein
VQGRRFIVGKEVGRMLGFNETIFDDARARVRQALEKGEPLELLAFPFGDTKLYVSNDPERVLGYVSFMMARTEFWIGFRPEDVERAKKRWQPDGPP